MRTSLTAYLRKSRDDQMCKMRTVCLTLALLSVVTGSALAAPITLDFDAPDTLAQYEADYNLTFASQTANSGGCAISGGWLTTVHNGSTGPIAIDFGDSIVGSLAFDFIPDRNYNITHRVSLEFVGGGGIQYDLPTAQHYDLDFGGNTVIKASWTGNWMEFSKVDNLTFTPLPEPATVGLLAIGGLALLRRRRGCRGRTPISGGRKS